MTEQTTPDRQLPDQQLPDQQPADQHPADQHPADGHPADGQLAAFNAGRGELAEHLGIVLTSIAPGQVTGTMPVAGNRQPYGLLHGGASAAFAETLGSIHAVISAGSDATAVGIELNCSHHSSARDGLVHGVSTPLRVGRTLATFEIVVSDEAGTRICTSRLTCAIRPARSS